MPTRYGPHREHLRIALCLVALSATPAPVFAQSHLAAASLSSDRRYVFDIPSQPLASALESYSRVTGIEIIYGSTVASGRQSTAVQGSLTAVEALRKLLNGSQLNARSVADDAVTVELPPRSAETVDLPPEKSMHRHYFSRIQTRLESAFCKDPRIRPGEYRAVLKFNIAADGQIHALNLVGTTGSTERDRLIALTLEGMRLGSPPPADLHQPVMMVILPRSRHTCG